MSNLSELLPAGAGAKSADFVASGTLGSGRTVSLNDDGTISASEVTYSQTALNGTYTLVSGVNEKVDICYDSGSDRLVLLYRVISGSIGGYARVLSLSGTTFSAGSAVQYNSGYTREGDVCYDSVNDKVLVTYRDDGDGGGDGTFRVGTVSNLSITFGAEGRFETDAVYSTEAEYHPTLEKIGLLYTLGGSAGGSLQVRIGEISGTTATFGSRVQITSDVAKAGHYIQPIDDNKFVVFYNDDNNSTYLYAVTVTVSGLVATLGTPTVIASLNKRITGLSVAGDKILATTWEGYYYYVQLSGANSYTTLASGQTNTNYRHYATVYEPVTNLFLAVYLDASNSNYTYSQNISVSGSTLTFSSSVLVSNTSSGYPNNDWGYAVTLDTSQNTMVANWHAYSSNISTLSAYRSEYEATNVSNFIGITDQAIADTATGAVIVQGGVSEKLSGLTVGADYYVQDDGSLTTGGLPYDISSATYDNSSFSVSSQDTFPEGIAFSPDGTTMFIVGDGTDTVYQYALSSAFDINTASYSSVSFNLSSQATAPTGIAFNLSGTKMYVVSGGTLRRVYQYTLSTAFNVSTASYDSVFLNVGNESTAPQDIKFNSSGTKIYVLQSNPSDALFQYSLSTPYDLSTGSYDSVSLNVSSQESTPTGFDFNADGTKLFIVGSSGDDINQYSLSTAFDLSTASFDSITFGVSSQDLVPTGINFSSSGTTIYILGSANDSVYQYSTSAGSTTVPAGRALSTTSILLEG